MSNKKSLGQTIIGIFIGAIFGLTMTPYYWGTAPYQVVISIVAGAVLGYFAVNPKQAWQQVKAAARQTPVKLDKIKVLWGSWVNKWKKLGYVKKRMHLFVVQVLGFSIISFMLLILMSIKPILTSLCQSIAMGMLLYSLYLSQTFLILFFEFSILQDHFFIRLWHKYLYDKNFKGEGEILGEIEDGKQVIVYNGQWLSFEWRFVVTFVYGFLKLALTLLLWFALAVAILPVLFFRFIWWLTVAFSSQTLFLKIFTGTALSVMSGTIYHSFSVGLGTAVVISVVLTAIHWLGWQPFGLFALFKGESKLKKAFAKANLFT